jgi:hypothetical protein
MKTTETTGWLFWSFTIIRAETPEMTPITKFASVTTMRMRHNEIVGSTTSFTQQLGILSFAGSADLVSSFQSLGLGS